MAILTGQKDKASPASVGRISWYNFSRGSCVFGSVVLNFFKKIDLAILLLEMYIKQIIRNTLKNF